MLVLTWVELLALRAVIAEAIRDGQARTAEDSLIWNEAAEIYYTALDAAYAACRGQSESFKTRAIAEAAIGRAFADLFRRE